jgi:hypothetical protein
VPLQTKPWEERIDLVTSGRRVRKTRAVSEKKWCWCRI